MMLPRKGSEKSGDKLSAKDIEDDGIALAELPGKGIGVDLAPPPKRRKKWRNLLKGTPPKPAADHFDPDAASLIPDLEAGWFSKLTFSWLDPLLALGYRRPLEKSDLWKLDEKREAAYLGDTLIANFEKRRAKAAAWNARLESGEYKPWAVTRLWWRFSANWLHIGSADGKRQGSLAAALSDTFFFRFWSAGFMDAFAGVANMSTPLITRQLIDFGQQSYFGNLGIAGYTDPGVGRGIGLAFGLWILIIATCISINHFFYRTTSVGVMVRASLIAALYRKGVKLDGASRVQLTNAKLVNYISTDVTRVDFACLFAHLAWTEPLALIACIVILLATLGYSALPGIGLVFCLVPGQSWIMKGFLKYRRQASVQTDARVKMTQELISGVKVIRYFAWEEPYIAKVNELRKAELGSIRKLLVLRVFNMSAGLSVPTIASVLSFVLYTATHPTERISEKIFPSLSLFYLLRFPLMTIPQAVSAIMDGKAALDRLRRVFVASTIDTTYEVDPAAEYAVEAVDASFAFESQPPEEAKPAPKKSKKHEEKKPVEEIISNDKPTFQLQDITIKIPRGQLVAIVGAVGAGKSALLQALIGEMKRLNGSVKFGGSLGYCAQQAWIQNATLRDNILFGKPYDQRKYNKVVRDACLEADLDMLPYGDLTQIGEKGITLSGGQRQRVNIARALYFDADIVTFDDPLSAVDAHVGKHLFQHAIKGALAGKTRILVTHALHFLPQVDYIYCLENGRISEHGTYADLNAKQGAFCRLMTEFGGEETAEELKEVAQEQDAIDGKEKPKAEQRSEKHTLMQDEERQVGSVSSKTWGGFFRAAKGHITVPCLLLSLALSQTATVLASYSLVWWQDNQFGWSNAQYMGLYGGLSVSISVLTFLMGVSAVFMGMIASNNLHSAAIQSVMHAPSSWFDTSPVGRILSRFTKDLDTLDNVLNDSFRVVLVTFGGVISTVALVTIVQQWFLIVIGVVVLFYWMAARYYRQSAREVKRLDNLLRSELYAHFSESLTGLSSIRAYNKTDDFIKQNERRIDIENRAYMIVAVNRSWLGFRLDMFGSVLAFAVAIIGVFIRHSVTPAQIGVSLTYIVTLTGNLTYLIRYATEVENDMNSIERLLHYSKALDQEAPAKIAANDPTPEWPTHGAISLKKILMAYRPGLPPVLKGFSLDIKGGEKIGLIGRTGSGKSSIMVSLFRMVELTSGTISIDGIDISKIGLETLRSRIALIPQDPLLFQGTIRSNLDPFKQYDDKILWDALQRSWLVDKDVPIDQSRFSLDTVIEDEGSNLSVGERSLVSLARALVKDSKIVLLDEATASVDYETDAKVQTTIATEFRDKTLITIAHRLLTIIGYDRLVVMSDGLIAEVDTPENLFKKPRGIFRAMAEKSGITLADIEKAQHARRAPVILSEVHGQNEARIEAIEEATAGP